MEHGFKSLMCFSKRGPVSRAPLPAYVTKGGNAKAPEGMNTRAAPDSESPASGRVPLKAELQHVHNDSEAAASQFRSEDNEPTSSGKSLYAASAPIPCTQG